MTADKPVRRAPAGSRKGRGKAVGPKTRAPDSGRGAPPAKVERNVFRTEVALRWSDEDALGFVNNAVYLVLLEEARAKFFDAVSARIRGKDKVRLEYAFMIGRHEIDYLRPLRFSSDPVVINCWVDRVGHTSFTYAYEVLNSEDLVVAQAKTVVVAVSSDGTGSQPIPAELRRALESFLHAR